MVHLFIHLLEDKHRIPLMFYNNMISSGWFWIKRRNEKIIVISYVA